MSWGDVDNPDKITTQAFAFIKVIQGLLRWGWAFRGYCYGVRHWGQAFRGYCFGVGYSGKPIRKSIVFRGQPRSDKITTQAFASIKVCTGVPRLYEQHPPRTLR